MPTPTLDALASKLFDHINYTNAYTDLRADDGFVCVAYDRDTDTIKNMIGGGYALDVWFLFGDDAHDNDAQDVCRVIAAEMLADLEEIDRKTDELNAERAERAAITAPEYWRMKENRFR